MYRRFLLVAVVFLVSSSLSKAQIIPISVNLGSNLRFGRLGGVTVDVNGAVSVSDIDGCIVRTLESPTNTAEIIQKSLNGQYDLKVPGNPYINAKGELLIPDIGSDLVLKFDSSGNYVSSIEGTVGKRFSDPSQVSEDSSGAIYVADKNNHRIVKFNSDRTPAWELGANGSNAGQFKFASGITVTPNDLIVASDELNDRLHVYSLSGNLVMMIDTSISGLGIPRPGLLTSQSDGTLWVVSNSTNKVSHIDLSGQMIMSLDYQSFVPSGRPNPVSVAVYGSEIYIADGENCQLYHFGHDGTFKGPMLQGIGSPDRLNLPYQAIKVNADYMIADTGNHRLSVFSAQGSFLRSIGTFGDALGQFQNPTSLSVSPEGLIAVADTGNNRIQVVRPDATIALVIPGAAANFTLSLPSQAVWGENGSLWIVDQNNSCIRQVNSSGNLLKTIGFRGTTDGQFESPTSIAIAPSGDIYVSDTHNHRIQRFANDGTHLATIGSYGAGPGQMNEPKGIVIFDSRYIIVADSGNHRLQIFRLDGAFVAEYGEYGENVGQFITPEQLSLNGINEIVVSDSSTHKVTAFVLDIDSSPPTSSISFVPDTGVNWSNKSIQVYVSAIDADSGVKEIHFSINSGVEQIVLGSNTSFILEESGSFQIEYWAVDNKDKIESTNFATVKIDKIAPVTTLTRSAGLITLSATDAHSGVAKIKYQIDGGAVADYSVPFADTIHKVTYWAEDVATNIEAAKTDIINAGVQSISVTQPRVTGGIGVIGTVTLDKSAGVGGTVINLTSSVPGVAFVDPTVTVPEGATTATFDIEANPVAVDTSVSVTASIYETSQSALVTVQAPMPSSVSWSVSPVSGGTSTVGTLSISGPAPSGGTTVALASSSLSALVASSVTIPAGSMTTTFTVTTNVVSNDTSAVISATVYGTKLKSTLSILGPKISSVTLAASSIASTTTTTGTVTLSTNAPVGGKVVNLSSSNAAVASVPVSVTVAAGARTATFTVTAGSVVANTNATITASTNGSSGTATITITPPAAVLSTLTTVVTAVTGGVPVTGTVTLTSAAPTGGAVVTLASSSTIIGTVPASVTVPAGATSATFTITTSAVTAASSLTITATRNGVSKTATITVNPVRIVSTLTLNPTSVRGGTNSTGTITLSGIATEAVVVTLTSATTTVARVPVSVTVPAGSTTATFTITTLAQTATRTSVITARTGTTSRTATLSVTR